MTAEELIARKIAQRSSAGLVLRFRVPGRLSVYVCYPRNEAEKACWLETARHQGWMQV